MRLLRWQSALLRIMSTKCILLEPIAKYFTKICDALKQLLNEPTMAGSPISTELENADIHQEEIPSE